MKLLRCLFFVASLFAFGFVFAGNAQNKDVRDFVADADMCQHFAGEWDSDLSRKEKKRIESSINLHCGNAQKQLKVLEKKYKTDKEVQAILLRYDSVQNFEK